MNAQDLFNMLINIQQAGIKLETINVGLLYPVNDMHGQYDELAYVQHTELNDTTLILR